MEIPDTRIEQALSYLSKTDEEYGMLKGRKAGLEYRLKVCLATESLAASGKSMSENMEIAKASDAYQAMVDEYENTRIEYEIMGAKRKKEELVIEVWRSVGANRRSGQV